MPSKEQNIRYDLFQLRNKGFTQKEIRSLTGIPERTQSRLINNAKHTLKSFNKQKFEVVRQLETRYNLDIDKIDSKNQIKDLIRKKSDSKYFKRYYEPKIKTTKSGDRTFKEIIINHNDFKNLDIKELKKLVRNKIYFITVSGKFKNKKGDTIPFVYSSQGKKNPNKRQLDNIDKFIEQYASSDIYKDWELTDISIITIE